MSAQLMTMITIAYIVIVIVAIGVIIFLILRDIKKQYKDIAKSDEDVLSIALFGDVAIKFLKQRIEDAKPTKIHVEV